MSETLPERVAALLAHPFYRQTVRRHRNRPSRSIVAPDANGCLLWQGATNSKGYPVGSRGLAHRTAYAAVVGVIPPGYEIHHVCRVRLCINVDHLACLTREEHARIEGRILKLDADRVRDLLTLVAGGTRHREIATQFGVTRPYISLIKHGERWGEVAESFWAMRGEIPTDARRSVARAA